MQWYRRSSEACNPCPPRKFFSRERSVNVWSRAGKVPDGLRRVNRMGKWFRALMLRRYRQRWGNRNETWSLWRITRNTIVIRYIACAGRRVACATWDVFDDREPCVVASRTACPVRRCVGTPLNFSSPCSIDRRRSSESPHRRADRCSPGHAVGPRSGKFAPGRSGPLRFRMPAPPRRQC